MCGVWRNAFVCYTIGMGVGGGMIAGQLTHGLVHPKMGYIFLARDRARPVSWAITGIA